MLKLTSPNGLPIFFKYGEICSVYPFENGSVIYITGGNSFEVKEDAEQISRYLSFKYSYDRTENIDTITSRSYKVSGNESLEDDFEEIFFYAECGLRDRMKKAEESNNDNPFPYNKKYYEDMEKKIADYKNRLVSITLQDVE